MEESPLNRISVPKRDRHYKGRYKLYKRFTLGLAGLLMVAVFIIVKQMRGTAAIRETLHEYISYMDTVIAVQDRAANARPPGPAPR